MSGHRWTLYDAVEDETIVWEMNPVDGALPALEKAVTTDSALQGGQIIWQGPDKSTTMPFTGTILTESHYQFFRNWYYREHEVLLTDDLGQEFTVFLTRFVAKRSLSTSHPWKATYDCSVLVVA